MYTYTPYPINMSAEIALRTASCFIPPAPHVIAVTDTGDYIAYCRAGGNLSLSMPSYQNFVEGGKDGGKHFLQKQFPYQEWSNF